jgi:hypothetical protein
VGRREHPPNRFVNVSIWSNCRLFLEKLVAAHRAGELQFFGNHAPLTDRRAFATLLAPLHNSKWVVYCKHPFGGSRFRPLEVFVRRPLELAASSDAAGIRKPSQ